VTPNSYPANAQVTAQTYCAIQNGFNSYDTDTLNFNSQTDGNSVNTNEVFNVPIGTTFYVIQSLSADASASSDLGNTGMYQPLSNKTPSSEASADAGNTAHFYLDVLTPGAALTTVSGHNYTMPPQLALLTTNAPGFTLAATCVPQQSWVLQYSTDMAHWSDVSTNQADISGQLQITLPAPNASSKYYRLRSP